MRNLKKIAGLALMLLISGSLAMNAQRGMKGMRPDSLHMRSDTAGMRMQGWRHMPMAMNQDTLKPGMRHQGYGMWQMTPRMGGQRGMMQPGFGMMHRGYGMSSMMPRMGGQRDMRMQRFGMQRMGRDSQMFGRGNRREMMQRNPGMRLMESMPNVTAKQKDDLAKLNEKQRKEMQELREKQQKEIKDIRESHRKKVMSLLTDEQKKWMEENSKE